MFLVTTMFGHQFFVPKDKLSEFLGELLANPLPIRHTENGVEAVKLTKEHVMVFDLSSLIVPMDSIKIQEPSNIIRPNFNPTNINGSSN